MWTVENVLSGIYYSVLVRNTCQHSQQTRRWPNAGPMLAHNLRALAQHQTSTGSTPRVCWAAFNPVNTKHYCSVSFVECFGMFWKSKKLQIRDYLFKGTEFFRIKYVKSWVVGLPYHPQLQNYMTLSIMILFTLLWFLESGWLNKRRHYLSKHDTLTQCWTDVSPTSSTLTQH